MKSPRFLYYCNSAYIFCTCNEHFCNIFLKSTRMFPDNFMTLWQALWQGLCRLLKNKKIKACQVYSGEKEAGVGTVANCSSDWMAGAWNRGSRCRSPPSYCCRVEIRGFKSRWQPEFVLFFICCKYSFKQARYVWDSLVCKLWFNQSLWHRWGPQGQSLTWWPQRTRYERRIMSSGLGKETRGLKISSWGTFQHLGGKMRMGRGTGN